MSKTFHDTLFDLYMIGGLESVTLASRGVKRELIIDLETSGLTPETGEIIRYRAVNRWDSEDEFDEWARPMASLTPEAERIVGVTNEQLSGCRPSDVVLEEFLIFLLKTLNERQGGLYGKLFDRFCFCLIAFGRLREQLIGNF